MALETVTNIADFVNTNPTGSDPKSQGDDHIRNIKKALLNDFAGFTGGVIVTGVDGGAADVYTLTPANALPAYTTKMLIEFTPVATNLTATPTINISALGAKTIKSVANAALQAGDLVISIPTLGIYNGTDILLIGPTKNYLDQLAFLAALPAQSLGLLLSSGSVASFTKSLTFGLNEAKAADVASSATPDIWAGNGNTLHITGSVTLTGFAAAPQAGAWRKLYFDGACLLTNGVNFNVQGAANYTTAAGDVVMVYADTTTKFYLLIFRADGSPVAFATSAEIKTGTTSKSISPVGLLAAIGASGSFQTTDQTITAAGSLTIAHGLGRKPVYIFGFLKNVTADANYVTNDEVPIALGATQAANTGVSVVPDATNLNIRYGQAGQTFNVIDKTSGVSTAITNANWKFFLRVLA